MKKYIQNETLKLKKKKMFKWRNVKIEITVKSEKLIELM